MILTNASGFHNVCVCKIHQNVKLMLNGMKLKSLEKNVHDFEIETYKDCFKKLHVIPPRQTVVFPKCLNSPGVSKLKE